MGKERDGRERRGKEREECEGNDARTSSGEWQG
jgi:hypothetical protein